MYLTRISVNGSSGKRSRNSGMTHKAVVYRHMSILNERTPLLPNHGENDSPRARTIARRAGEDTSIASRARSVLHSLRLHPNEALSLDPEPSVLVILLQASQSLDHYIEETTANVEERSIFTAALREDVELAIGTRLDDEVKRILGIWVRDGVDDELLYDALWKRWDIGNGSVSSGEVPVSPCLALTNE